MTDCRRGQMTGYMQAPGRQRRMFHVERCIRPCVRGRRALEATGCDIDGEPGQTCRAANLEWHGVQRAPQRRPWQTLRGCSTWNVPAAGHQVGNQSA